MDEFDSQTKYWSCRDIIITKNTSVIDEFDSRTLRLLALKLAIHVQTIDIVYV